MRNLYDFCSDKITFEQLIELIDQQQLSAPWRLNGEAHFHAAAKSWATGDHEQAINHWFSAYRSFDDEQSYSFHAKMLYERIRLESPGGKDEYKK